MVMRSIAGTLLVVVLWATGNGAQTEDCSDGDINLIQDGSCDMENNNEGCLYDGGDCCVCTRIDDGPSPYSDISSAFLFCVDPSASCYDREAVALQSTCIDGDIEDIGDGRCDKDNNNEGCQYDDGDCCECTLSTNGSTSFSSGGSSPLALSDDSSRISFCVNPSDPCYNLEAVNLQSTCKSENIDWIQNGICNDANNNEECLYDGGDCCECTRYDDEASSDSDPRASFYFCVDPSASCYDGAAVALQSKCIDGDFEDLGNGICDEENNNDGCDYDKGDCCPCTCVSGNYPCGSHGFSCLDPNVTSLEPYICVESPPNNASCPAGDQQDWIVENAAQAHALLGAVRCPGESFSVRWKGKVVMNETISIFDGTVLNVTGIDEGATIDGGGQKRLFSVVNASLHMHNITVSNGNDSYGGAIAAARSRLALKHVSFFGNTASSGGGAIFMSNGSMATFDGETHFFNNSAHYGGALYVMSRSNASWIGNVTFSENAATSKNGGAIFIVGKSSAIWDAASKFTNNSAQNDGGALYVTDSSSAIWTAASYFLENRGSYGGVLYMDDQGTAVWSAVSYFRGNNGSYGGGLYVAENSSVIWKAKSYFFNNSGSSGGALYLVDGSSSSWISASVFEANSASYKGGAVYVESDSKVVWRAVSQFRANMAGSDGGAVYLTDKSNALWKQETIIANNTASLSGGALYVKSGSSAVWTAASKFLKNIAETVGGALCVVDNSRAIWAGQSYFHENLAGSHGGALYTAYSSTAEWRAALTFSANNAQDNGGGVYAIYNASLSWTKNALFVNNIAENGGALFVTKAVTTQWSGKTNFTSNNARSNGGAVGSRVLDSVISYSANYGKSYIYIKATTIFMDNTCGANGGAIALVQSLAVSFESEDTRFLRNSANISGGAAYVADTGIGPLFRNVIFEENSAQTGGAVHSTGSGTTVAINGDSQQVANPTTFDGCNFVRNLAFATGGAVDSASGQDVFNQTIFEGNEANVGGALRLAGMASVVNCSFRDNISKLDEGPTVSNIGYISSMTDCYFRDNVFDCEPHTFLQFQKNQDAFFETICDGCPGDCGGCVFAEEKGTPTCTSLSQAGVEHASSEGGNTTLEYLQITEGYWRANSTSINVYKCFNTKACKGGITGASGYCLAGYGGPYCSVCSSNYFSGLSFTCWECANLTIGIAVGAVLIVLVLAFGFAMISFLVSGEVVGGTEGAMNRMKIKLPMQAIKTIIITWQILTQFASVANVTFPDVYQTFLDGVNFLNFDLSWVVSTGCFIVFDIHDRLLWMTIAPIVTMCLLGATYVVAMRRNRESPLSAVRHVQQKHVSVMLLLTFLVYSSVSSVVFQMFSCENLDDGKSYLRADYTIECDSFKHRGVQIYASLMIVLYPLGIPALYAMMLFKTRQIIQSRTNHVQSVIVRSTSSLWKPYKPQRFYYGLIECARRILLAGAIVFIHPNTVTQVAVAFAIAVFFVFVSEAMSPYKSLSDAWVSRMGHAIVLASFYLALLMKVDASGENKFSQKTFAVVLVAAHGCVMLAMVAQALIMTASFKVTKPQVNPRPRNQRSTNCTRKVQASQIEEDDTCKDELDPGI